MKTETACVGRTVTVVGVGTVREVRKFVLYIKRYVYDIYMYDGE